MSEKVSLEALLPVACELYKSVKPDLMKLRNEPEPKQEERAKAIADSFASFTLYLHQKLSESK